VRNTIKLNISCYTLNLYFWGIFFAPVIAYVIIGLVFGASLEGWWLTTSPESTAIFITSMALIFIVHEALHIVVFLIGGVKLKEISLISDVKNLSIVIECKKEISVGIWRFSLIMPFLVLTPALLVIAFFSDPANQYWLLLAISISACAYDLALLRGLSGLSSSQVVVPEGRAIDGYLFIDEVRNQV